MNLPLKKSALFIRFFPPKVSEKNRNFCTPMFMLFRQSENRMNKAATIRTEKFRVNQNAEFSLERIHAKENRMNQAATIRTEKFRTN